MKAKSWECKGCTNICYRMLSDGNVYAYCRPILEGRHRTEWITDSYVDCLDRTFDPAATDPVTRIHEEVLNDIDDK